MPNNPEKMLTVSTCLFLRSQHLILKLQHVFHANIYGLHARNFGILGFGLGAGAFCDF